MNEYPFNPVKKWHGEWLMKPEEFVRERQIGEITITLPEPPKDITQILNYDKPIKDQRWIKSQSPDFKKIPVEEQKAYLRQELDRREKGIFVYIHGGIEYLTGVHYWMLQNWIIDGRSMKFIDAQRDFFYTWKQCIDDPQCFGEAFYTNRRFGKSEIGMGIVYEYVSKTPSSHGGIQSKTNSDASKIFRKLIQRWKRLPSFWKPVHSGEKLPKKSLNFEEPSTKTTKGEHVYKDVLDSFIDYMPAVEEAYDGDKMQIYYDDEFGKAVGVNAYNRWDIVKECLAIGNKIIGKSIHTTTVEELERKGGQAALDIWNDSNPKERGSDGRTRSGLFRYFNPAYYGLEGFVDEYGFTDVESADAYLLKKREGLSGERLAREQRKYPRTPYEAFMSVNDGNVFPIDRINDQQIYNETLLNGTVRTGNFIWTDEARTKVEFQDDPNGKWNVSWMPKVEDQNAVERDLYGIRPKNIFKGGIGVDPFDHTRVVYGSGSNGSIYVCRKFDAAEPTKSYAYVCEYVYRPAMPQIFYEDVAKTCVFYGMKVLIENNKPGCIEWMKNNGFKGYIEKTQVGEFSKSNSRNWIEGIATTGEGVREAIINGLVLYQYNYIGKISEKTQVDKMGLKEDQIIIGLYGNCPFDKLLKDWKAFDVTNWTPYDATVASGLALMMANRTRVKEVAPDGSMLTTLFKEYKVR